MSYNFWIVVFSMQKKTSKQDNFILIVLCCNRNFNSSVQLIRHDIRIRTVRASKVEPRTIKHHTIVRVMLDINVVGYTIGDELSIKT